MSLLDTDFLLKEDQGLIRDVGSLVLAQWGPHTTSLIDCVTYYTLVIDEIKGPPITAEPCESKVDLCLVSKIVTRWPGRIRDFRLEWSQTDMRGEFDIFKHGIKDLKYPEIDWVEYDETVFEKRLEELKISFLTQPNFWGDILPMLKAVVQTIYNKTEYHSSNEVGLGIEEDTESCYLTFGNMDQVNYAVLARIAEQSHILDMNVRAIERRLDIRVKFGKATPWPLRSLTKGKRSLDSDEKASKRHRS